MPNIKPNLGISVIAAAFGREQTINDEADPWVKALIREENAREVNALKPPDAGNPVFQKAWQRIEYMQEHSDMPPRLVNVPSPLVTASLIWDYTSFIEATMIFPDEVHVLMEKVTEATILYIKEQLARIKNLYTMGHEMVYIPRDAGVRLSDDTAALMSPALYREFGVKYNGMISRAFGGIVIHSRGDVQHVVGPMMETPGLRGLDFTIPQTPAWQTIREAAAGKTVLCLRHYHGDHAAGSHVDMVDYTKKIVDFFGRKGLILLTSMETYEESAAYSLKPHELLAK
jgi:uroporphyrinogen-III decarboxylase